MKHFAWAALTIGLILAGAAQALPHARDVHRCQDQSQVIPGRPPSAPGRPNRGVRGGPPSGLGVRPQGPVTPSYGYGSSLSNRGNYDRHTYQRNETAAHRYHSGAYAPPPNWSYRRWTYGEMLPAGFWAQNYWLTSWATFGLMQPPFGYQWVRYGNDAILVDTTTGEILQVQYGVFY